MRRVGKAGQDGEGQASDLKRRDFFIQTTKYAAVAAFQANDPDPGQGFGDHGGVDVGLGRGGAEAFLAHVDQLGGGGDQGEDIVADEAVVDDHVGGLNGFENTQGQMVSSTRTGTGKDNRVERGWLGLSGHGIVRDFRSQYRIFSHIQASLPCQ